MMDSVEPNSEDVYLMMKEVNPDFQPILLEPRSDFDGSIIRAEKHPNGKWIPVYSYKKMVLQIMDESKAEKKDDYLIQYKTEGHRKFPNFEEFMEKASKDEAEEMVEAVYLDYIYNEGLEEYIKIDINS